nr:hypothetical protein [Tanacetum cinerariifolium]
MVAILEKSKHNLDFHPMVYFIEASPLRRNLKLKDEEGISSLPDTELFENLTLMGYNISPNQKFTFQKGLMSSVAILPALVCLATNRTYNFSKMIFEGLVKNVNNKVSKFLMYPSQGEACPTDSGFIADQDRATIAKSSTLSYDSAPRVTSLAADEGSMQQTISKLTALCTSLQRQHSELLAKFQAQEGRSVDEGEAAAERISDDSEEMATVLTSMDAATILVGGIADVPTGSGSIPTASPPVDEVSTGSDMVPTASLIFATATVVTPYKRRKGKEVRVEFDTPKKQKVQEQIDAQSQQRKPWTKKQKRDYYMAVIRSNLGWKEEAERIKRKGLSLEQESVNKQKTSEEVPEEAKSPDEVPKEKVKEMIQLVPIEEVYVEALQVKHPIMDWKNFMHALVEWKLYDSCGVHHVTSKDKEIFMLVEKDYPLRKGLALVMICYKLQVENYLQMANDLILKIYKIANSPR